jgi:hypothetical protein
MQWRGSHGNVPILLLVKRESARDWSLLFRSLQRTLLQWCQHNNIKATGASRIHGIQNMARVVTGTRQCNKIPTANGAPHRHRQQHTQRAPCSTSVPVASPRKTDESSSSSLYSQSQLSLMTALHGHFTPQQQHNTSYTTVPE